MLMAGFGLGLSGTAAAVGVLTGARDDEAGMISGASATGHELGGTLGIAIYASIATAASGGTFVGPSAATGIAHAFLIAGFVALADRDRSDDPAPRRGDVPGEAAAQSAGDGRSLKHPEHARRSPSGPGTSPGPEAFRGRATTAPRAQAGITGSVLTTAEGSFAHPVVVGPPSFTACPVSLLSGDASFAALAPNARVASDTRGIADDDAPSDGGRHEFGEQQGAYHTSAGHLRSCSRGYEPVTARAGCFVPNTVALDGRWTRLELGNCEEWM